MNWMGGARNRLKVNGEKKRQREFFEKRKRNAAQARIASSPSDTSMSRDLISFYLKQRNLKNSYKEPKPTKVIKEDLEKRSSSILSHVNLPKLSPENIIKEKISPTEKWKVKRKLKHPKMISAPFEDFDIENENRMFEHTNSPTETSLHMSNMDGYEPDKTLEEAYFKNKTKNYISNNFDSSIILSRDNQSKHSSNSSNYPFQTNDINEAFKKYVYVDRFQNLKKHKELPRNSKPDYETLHMNVLREQFNNDVLLSKGADELNSKCHSKRKSKLFEKMNIMLSKYENKEMANGMSVNSNLSLSGLSKHTFASIPRKVSRANNIFISGYEDLEQLNSDFHSDKNYRHSLSELEKMIQEATLQRQQEDKMSNGQSYSPESQESENEFRSPSSIDSSSSSHSNLSIPDFFKKKRKFETSINMPSVKNCNVTSSYKKIRTTVTDKKKFGADESIVNCQRMIKISDTTVLTPQFNCAPNSNSIVINMIDKNIRNNKKSAIIENRMLPSSLLTYFPTPGIKKPDKLSHELNPLSDSLGKEYALNEETPNVGKSSCNSNFYNEQLVYRNTYNQRNSSESQIDSEHYKSNHTVDFSDKAEVNRIEKYNNKESNRKIDVATSPFPCFKALDRIKPVCKKGNNQETCEMSSTNEDFSYKQVLTKEIFESNCPVDKACYFESNKSPPRPFNGGPSMLANEIREEELACENVVDRQITEHIERVVVSPEVLPPTLPSTPTKLHCENCFFQNKEEQMLINCQDNLGSLETVRNSSLQVQNINSFQSENIPLPCEFEMTASKSSTSETNTSKSSPMALVFNQDAKNNYLSKLSNSDTQNSSISPKSDKDIQNCSSPRLSSKYVQSFSNLNSVINVAGTPQKDKLHHSEVILHSVPLDLTSCTEKLLSEQTDPYVTTESDESISVENLPIEKPNLIVEQFNRENNLPEFEETLLLLNPVCTSVPNTPEINITMESKDEGIIEASKFRSNVSTTLLEEISETDTSISRTPSSENTCVQDKNITISKTNIVDDIQSPSLREEKYKNVPVKTTFDKETQTLQQKISICCQTISIDVTDSSVQTST